MLAATYYECGCGMGDGTACGNLGQLHAKGQIGTGRDFERAAVLYRQGCNFSDAESCKNLAQAYLSGRGVEKDRMQALSLLHRARSLSVRGLRR